MTLSRRTFVRASFKSKECSELCGSACNIMLYSTCEAKIVNIVPVPQDKENELTVVDNAHGCPSRRTRASLLHASISAPVG